MERNSTFLLFTETWNLMIVQRHWAWWYGEEKIMEDFWSKASLEWAFYIICVPLWGTCQVRFKFMKERAYVNWGRWYSFEYHWLTSECFEMFGLCASCHWIFVLNGWSHEILSEVKIRWPPDNILWTILLLRNISSAHEPNMSSEHACGSAHIYFDRSIFKYWN